MRFSFVTFGPEFSTSARRSTSRKRRVRSRFTGRVSNASIASSTFCRKFSANLVLLCSAPYVCRARSADVSSNSAASTRFSRGASPSFQSDEARLNLRVSVVPQSGIALRKVRLKHRQVRLGRPEGLEMAERLIHQRLHQRVQGPQPSPAEVVLG